MDEPNPGYQYFLYALHQKGHTALESHAELLKATGTEMLTLEQVTEHFEKMTTGEFTMKVDDSATEKPDIFQLLATLPIQEALMAHCDLSDRLALRAVSHALKDLVDDSPLKLQTLSIGNDGRSGYIKADNIEWRYNKIPKGYVLSNGTRAILKKSDKWFMGHQQAHLTTILRLPKLEIDELTIHEDEESKNGVNFASMILLGAAPEYGALLKVRQIQVCHPNILTWFDPKHLKVFKLIGGVVEGFSSMDHLSRLEQWSNLKELITSRYIDTKDIVSNFGHLEYMDYVLPVNCEMRSEALVRLKDNFLLRPQLQKFEIIPSFDHPEDDPMFIIAPESFLPFQDPNNKQWYHFKYPNSAEKLSVKIAYDGILFKGPCYSGDKIDIRRRVLREVEVNNDDEGW